MYVCMYVCMYAYTCMYVYMYVCSGTMLTTADRSTMYGGTLLEQCNGVCKYYALNIYVYKLVKIVDEKMYPSLLKNNSFVIVRKKKYNSLL